MSQLVTMNVSVDQIERDLRAGKSVQEIAQDWSEPAPNVYAVQRAMQARDGAGVGPLTPAVPPRPVPPQPRSAVTADVEETSALDLVEQASKSKNARTRSLGAKLDKLVEELTLRLDVEHKEQAEVERKRQEQAAARAEVDRLEQELREARARAGLRGAGVARGNTAGRSPARIAAMARVRAAAHGEFPCSKGCGKVSTTKAGQLSHERACERPA